MTRDHTIADLLAERRRPTFSFEFFPPKSPQDAERLWQAIDRLVPLEPDFVSVTYGANGGSRHRTLAITERLAQESSLRVMGHLTCASQSSDELVRAIEDYRSAGVHHVLAVRGDMPGGPTEPWVPHPQGLANATELVRLVKQTGDFCVGVAAFPDPHPQTQDPDLDARLLVAKAEAGAQLAITQLFFRATSYTAMVERVRALGCDVPILAGIMPITQIGQIRRFADFSGAELPAEVTSRIEEVADDPQAVREAGVEIATELSLEVLRAGAPGLHFFTQNRSTATRQILARVRAAS